MGKQYLLTLLLVAILVVQSLAQQALFGGQQRTSPEINDSNSVTFRIMANDAKEVKISGDWMPFEGWMPGSAFMEKDDKGIWTYTTGILDPELYGYAFLIDGFRTTDPNNAFVNRDIAALTNIFIIGGGQADLYRVNDVPHGSVTKRWYDSPGNGMDR